MAEPMLLRIRSDGTPAGTTVEDADTGRPLHNVRAVTWRCDAENLSVATIELMCVEVDLVGATEQEK